MSQKKLLQNLFQDSLDILLARSEALRIQDEVEIPEALNNIQEISDIMRKRCRNTLDANLMIFEFFQNHSKELSTELFYIFKIIEKIHAALEEAAKEPTSQPENPTKPPKTKKVKIEKVHKEKEDEEIPFDPTAAAFIRETLENILSSASANNLANYQSFKEVPKDLKNILRFQPFIELAKYLDVEKKLEGQALYQKAEQLMDNQTTRLKIAEILESILSTNPELLSGAKSCYAWTTAKFRNKEGSQWEKYQEQLEEEKAPAES